MNTLPDKHDTQKLDTPAAPVKRPKSKTVQWARYMPETKPKQLGTLNVDGQPLPVWQVEITDGRVEGKDLVELADEFKPSVFDIATASLWGATPGYVTWPCDGNGLMSWPVDLAAGGWIAVRSCPSSPYRHHYVVEASPFRAVLLQTAKRPAKWPGLVAIQNGLQSEGVRFRAVEPTLRFEFIAGENGTVLSLVQPAFTRYGIRCVSRPLNNGGWEKTYSNTLSRGHHDIRTKAERTRLHRICSSVEHVLDGVLAANPKWTPKARRFEAYCGKFTPGVEQWLQQQLLDALVQSDEAMPAEFVASTPEGEDAANQLRSKHERTLERRLATTKAKAEAQMQLAPVRPPHAWKIRDDGIYIEGPWDDILGPRFRDLHAKWLRPGWRLSLRHAQTIAELFRELPQLQTRRQELLAQIEEMSEGVPLPSGYNISLCGMTIHFSGGGNKTLDEQLTILLGAGKTYECDYTNWTVRPEQLAGLQEVIKQHPPAPKPPPASES